MAARSVWKGAIQFGMVSIPVKLYPAVEDRDISFHLLHAQCGVRIKQQRFCANCERVIDWGDVKRGYEVTKGQHLVLEEADFQSLPLKTIRALSIEGFTAPQPVPPIAMDKPYYLAPEELGAKPFVLLRDTMRDLGVVGVGKIAIREKEQLGVLSPYGDILLLYLLRYADEIRSPDFALPAITLTDKEKNLGRALVQSLTCATFELGAYRDEYRAALEQLIQARLMGQPVPALPEGPKVEALDLADMLMASLKGAK